MNKSTDERERRLAQLRREVTRRGFERHASVLKDVSELPVEFQTSAALELAECESIQRIILFPPQLRGRDYVPKQALLFAQSGILHLMSSIWPDQTPQATYVHACDLMYTEITLILLYGFIDILALGQGSLTRLGLEFNTVAWCLLTKPIHKLLQTGMSPSRSWSDESQYLPTMQRAVDGLPVKFANGTKIYGLLPGEQLEELVFQPGTSKPWLHFFRRPLTPNTVLLLTSHYVVLIREDLKISQGWIFTYIPRECIVEMKTQPCDLYSSLIINLKRGDQTAEYKLFLASEAVDAWHARWIQHGGHWEDPVS
jgi:hypothetical protein